ncbi:MAG: hypothetical protein Fur0044_41960 [Anaerolineae bacterium]
MIHPDLLLDMSNLQHQDRLREVETWRLAQIARQQRAHYVGQLMGRLVAAVRQWLSLPAHPKPVKPDLVNQHR